MDAVTIKFKANGQQLTRVGSDKFAANTVSYIRAEFELVDNWSGFDSVRAVWATDFAKVATVLDGSGSCVVPWEVLNRTGTLYVNLVGSISDGDELTDRLTTYKAKALDVNGCTNVEGTETAPLTPSQFEQFVAIVEELVHSVKDIDRIEVNDDYTLTVYYSDGTSYTSPSLRGEKGETGNGIASAVLNADYTLTLTFTDGNSYTTPSIRGAQGIQGETGNGIDRIELTDTQGAVKTYTIYFTNGTTTTFQVTDGEVTLAQLSAVLPTDTASGAIASFPDGSNLFDYLSCVVNIEPVQAGSGTPSPDNVRPITGWTGCEVVKAGVNLLDVDNFASGVDCGNDYFAGGRNAVAFSKAGTYTIKANTPSAGYLYARIKNADGTFEAFQPIIQSTTYTPRTMTVSNGQTLLLFDAISNTLATTKANVSNWSVQVETGSTAHAYETYNATTYPVSWQTEAGTVYGGTVDIVSGVLTVDRVSVTFDGTESWYSVTTGTGANRALKADVQNSPTGSYTWDLIGNYITPTGGAESMPPLWTANFNLSGHLLVGIPTTVTTVAEWKTYLSSNPLQFVYKLATPQTYRLDPVQMACLLGQNNVWADCGDVDEVKYKADVQLYIEKMLNS